MRQGVRAALPYGGSRGSRSGSQVRLVGEMMRVSVRMKMSANDNLNDCLYNDVAAESFVIVHEKTNLAEVHSSVRSFAYNRHVDCFAFELCIWGYVD